MAERICVSGYYGFDNFGDETVLNILCNNLKSFKNVEKITVFSKTPEKTAKNYGVNSVQTFDFTSVLKIILRSTCLISGGGSLLQDVTSKKSLIYYLFVIYTALITGKKVIIFAQGTGPINCAILRFLTLFALKRVKYITVRDEKSYNMLREHGIKCELCDDPVWNIDLKEYGNSNKSGKVGVQLRAFPSLTDEFIHILAKFICDNYKNKKILLLSLQNSIDLPACEKLKSSIQTVNPETDVEIIENTSNEKVIKDICSLDELIAMRYHACLIAIKANIKLLPLSYDKKVATLASKFNIPYIDLNAKKSYNEILKKFTEENNDYNIINTEEPGYNFKEMEKRL